MCFFAAWGGHLKVLQWLRQRGCSCGLATCVAAATGGHLEVLKWAREQDCPWDAFMVRACATKGGHHEVLKWLETVTK